MYSIKKNKIIIILVIFLFILPNVFATYPVIVSEYGVNHTQAKQLVYSIPEEYYRYVDVVEFVNKPIKKYNWINDYEAIVTLYDGWYYTYWNKDHVCYNGKILIYNMSYDTLQHEIGHIYEHCFLKEDISTENFANEFTIK